MDGHFVPAHAAGVSCIMSRFYILLVLCLLVSGCEDHSFDFFDTLRGVETELIVITDVPRTIDGTIEIKPKEPVEVVGNSSSLCLSLLGDIEHTDSKKEFSTLIDGIQVLVVGTTIDGKKTEFSSESRSWSMYGSIEPSNEISLCLLECPCKDKSPYGTKYENFEITFSQPLDVKGIYWHSTNRWDEKN